MRRVSSGRGVAPTVAALLGGCPEVCLQPPAGRPLLFPRSIPPRALLPTRPSDAVRSTCFPAPEPTTPSPPGSCEGVVYVPAQRASHGDRASRDRASRAQHLACQRGRAGAGLPRDLRRRRRARPRAPVTPSGLRDGLARLSPRAPRQEAGGAQPVGSQRPPAGLVKSLNEIRTTSCLRHAVVIHEFHPAA